MAVFVFKGEANDVALKSNSHSRWCKITPTRSKQTLQQNFIGHTSKNCDILLLLNLQRYL